MTGPTTPRSSERPWPKLLARPPLPLPAGLAGMAIGMLTFRWFSVAGLKLLLGVIPQNEAVSYAHRDHQSLFTYDPRASASKAYVQVVASLVRYLSQAGA